jgi:hypothetical protein
VDLAPTDEEDSIQFLAAAVGRDDVDGRSWYYPTWHRVNATVDLGPDDEGVTVSQHLVSGVRGFGTPLQVILLPNGAVEAVVTP